MWFCGGIVEWVCGTNIHGTWNVQCLLRHRQESAQDNNATSVRWESRLAVNIRTSVGITTRIRTINKLVSTDNEVLDQDRAYCESNDVAIRRKIRQEVLRRTRRSGVINESGRCFVFEGVVYFLLQVRESYKGGVVAVDCWGGG